MYKTRGHYLRGKAMNNGSRRESVLYEARELWRTGFVTLDTETSGLDPDDQILQWAVCSQDGTVLGGK